MHLPKNYLQKKYEIIILYIEKICLATNSARETKVLVSSDLTSQTCRHNHHTPRRGRPLLTAAVERRRVRIRRDRWRFAAEPPRSRAERFSDPDLRVPPR